MLSNVVVVTNINASLDREAKKLIYLGKISGANMEETIYISQRCQERNAIKVMGDFDLIIKLILHSFEHFRKSLISNFKDIYQEKDIITAYLHKFPKVEHIDYDLLDNHVEHDRILHEVVNGTQEYLGEYAIWFLQGIRKNLKKATHDYESAFEELCALFSFDESSNYNNLYVPAITVMSMISKVDARHKEYIINYFFSNVVDRSNINNFCIEFNRQLEQNLVPLLDFFKDSVMYYLHKQVMYCSFFINENIEEHHDIIASNDQLRIHESIHILLSVNDYQDSFRNMLKFAILVNDEYEHKYDILVTVANGCPSFNVRLNVNVVFLDSDSEDSFVTDGEEFNIVASGVERDIFFRQKYLFMNGLPAIGIYDNTFMYYDGEKYFYFSSEGPFETRENFIQKVKTNF